MKGSNIVVIINLCKFRCVIITSLACENLATLSCDVPLHRKIFVRLKVSTSVLVDKLCPINS